LIKRQAIEYKKINHKGKKCTFSPDSFLVESLKGRGKQLAETKRSSKTIYLEDLF